MSLIKNKKLYSKVWQDMTFDLILVRLGRTARLLPLYFGFVQMDYRQKNPFKCHIVPPN
jgi:hypothetical protein